MTDIASATSIAPSRDSSLGYRPALDGIRAVAVLAVIAYHFGYRHAQGGFLGVDIFFVLSGYLITSLLLAEHARTGKINLVAFWYRRAKRLLPALFLMLVVVAIWIGAYASPFELILRREDLIWTLFYGANWHFIASGQDYFAQYASVSPLRHTWSLAIEEQFYLAWPLLVAAALWLGRRRTAVVAGLCIAVVAGSALAMALLYDPGDPSRAYYGTDARMHELLVGALLAVLVREYPGRRLMARSSRAAPAVAVTAGLVLLGAFTLLSDTDPLYYRGLSLTLSLAAAALVWAVEIAPRSWPARLLALRPFAWIGQISYGLYLWHWPVVLAITSASDPFRLLPSSVSLSCERLLITFAVATCSFYLLEQPIRRGVVPVIGPSILRFAGAILTAGVLVGCAAYWQTSALAPEITSRTEIPDCPNFSICERHQGPAGGPVVALIGDSLARSLDPAFVALAHEHGWTYVLAASDGCRVSRLLSVYEGSVRPLAQRCYDRTPGVLQDLVDQWRPSVIVAMDRWELTDFVGQDGSTVNSGTADHQLQSAQALYDVATQLTSQGARLVFIELPPILHSDCGKRSLADTGYCRRTVSADEVDTPFSLVLRGVAARTPDVATISITDAICPNGVCVAKINGILLRFDGLHFTSTAAVWLAPFIYRELVHAGASPQ